MFDKTNLVHNFKELMFVMKGSDDHLKALLPQQLNKFYGSKDSFALLASLTKIKQFFKKTNI